MPFPFSQIRRKNKSSYEEQGTTLKGDKIMSGKTFMWVAFTAALALAYSYAKGRSDEARKIKDMIEKSSIKRWRPITEEEEQAFRQSHGDRKREA